MSSSPDESTFSNKKLLWFLLLFSVGGVIIACLGIYFSRIGLFNQWKSITQVPENTAEVIYGYPGVAYIRTIQGDVLSCAIGNNEECWIPDVVTDRFSVQPCNKQKVPFLFRPTIPQNLTSCVITKTFYPERTSTVIYAIDQKGILWKWELDNGVELLLAPFLILAGGLGGTLLGSIIWAIKGRVYRKRMPLDFPSFPKTQFVLLLLPWICLLTIVVLRFSVLSAPALYTNTSQSKLFTAVAETVVVQMAELPQEWPVEVTRSPDKVSYSFSQYSCDAEWTSGFYTIPCYEESKTSGLVVSKLADPLMGGTQMKGSAIWVRMAVDHDSTLVGKYPRIDIHEGDHFKTSMGCLDISPICDVIFEVSYELPDKKMISLGKWRPSGKDKIQDIDLDLSKLAGQSVVFYLSISDYNSTRNNQYPIWFMPRIEN